MTATSETATPVRNANRKVQVLMAVTLFLFTAPIIQEWTAQPASRYLFTVAAWDDHSVELDRYQNLLGIDQAKVGDHIVSDKAPYQPLAAVPAFAVYRVLGGAPVPQFAHGDVSYGMWLVTIWSSTIPAIALALLMRALVRRVYPDVATRVALALAIGTVIFPFSSLLFGHMLAAVFVFGGWCILREKERSNIALFAAGAMLGASVGVEYPIVAIAGILIVATLADHRWRHLFTCAGGAVAGIPLFAYNWIVFGGPTKTAYQGYQPNFQGEGALGVVNLAVPVPTEIARALIGDRGLFFLTPVTILALIGCWIAIRGKTKTVRDAWVAISLFVLFLALTTGIDGIGGYSPGPRYLIPVLPFFALPLAEAWRRYRLACSLTARLGGFFMVLALITDPLPSGAIANAPRMWIEKAFSRDFSRSIQGEFLGNWAILLTVAAALVALSFTLKADRLLREPDPCVDAAASPELAT